MSETVVGRVSAIHRYPLKSMLGEELESVAFDQRGVDADRFRPNLVVDTDDLDGFVETAWQGRTLQVGPVELRVSVTVPRCIMTALPQGDLPADRDTPGTSHASSGHPPLPRCPTRWGPDRGPSSVPAAPVNEMRSDRRLGWRGAQWCRRRSCRFVR